MTNHFWQSTVKAFFEVTLIASRGIRQAWKASGWNAEINDVLLLQDGRFVVAGVEPYSAQVLETGGYLVNVCKSDSAAPAIEQSSSGVIIVSLTDGLYENRKNYGLYRSDDNGTSWDIVLGDVANIRSLHDAGSGVFMASSWGESIIDGEGAGLYRSTDDGQTWTSFVTGLTNTEVRSVFSSGTLEFAGTKMACLFHRMAQTGRPMD